MARQDARKTSRGLSTPNKVARVVILKPAAWPAKMRQEVRAVSVLAYCLAVASKMHAFLCQTGARTGASECRSAVRAWTVIGHDIHAGTRVCVCCIVGTYRL